MQKKNVLHLNLKYTSAYTDREIRILVNRCDICNNKLPQTPENDNLEYRMDVQAEINNSFESAQDKSEPKLLLCARCSDEYMISS